MFIAYNGKTLEDLRFPNERESFQKIYKMTPEEFMDNYEVDYKQDLTGKYVVSVTDRNPYDEPDPRLKTNYAAKILSVYAPLECQRAVLEYHGHIAFVKIYYGERLVTTLYQDDECDPMSLDDYYNYHYGNDCDFGDDTVVQTKEQFIELVKLIIRAYAQKPQLDLNIKPEDIIVLHGL